MHDVDAAMFQWRNEYPDLDILPMSIIGRLAQFEAVARAAIEGPLESAGLRRGEFDVLATLRRSGEPFALTPATLADQLLITRAGLTSRLDRLESAELITRTPDPTDGRGKRVTLTEAGRALIERLLPGHVERVRGMLAPLSDEDLRSFDSLLRSLTALPSSGDEDR
ncbi:DNA-binding transcriptional regulator, MarR family [Tsukamurella pulmonis]|uniref:DNA-binding transcriptional regulator, MarR family n=1 Tax=Tsukamurella pulmonis TaxID=47312 RepID=A0A1H1EJY9_9ACTN|nr:MarR family transcriptional regulator [Tsukamurella pulmonis]SDQ89091.1 DNA-binding transcriptional regulator, MarR family [Tsukamurella pulmonis]SUP20784.1 Multiple antibiotic resistance protein marR [Tsukamurella pulmonis]